MLSDDEKKIINYLENEYKKLEKEGNILFPLYKQQAKIILNLIAKLKKENKELKSDNLEKARILEVFDDRKYRKKYLEERRKEETNLLYPDGDEIYKRYYEQKKQIDLMAEYINNSNYVDSEECQFQYDFKIKKCIEKGDCKDCIKQYFESKSKEE